MARRSPADRRPHSRRTDGRAAAASDRCRHAGGGRRRRGGAEFGRRLVSAAPRIHRSGGALRLSAAAPRGLPAAHLLAGLRHVADGAAAFRTAGARHADAPPPGRGDRRDPGRGAGAAQFGAGRHPLLPGRRLPRGLRIGRRGAAGEDARPEGLGGGDRGAGAHHPAGLRGRTGVLRQRPAVGHPQHPLRHHREYRRLQLPQRHGGNDRRRHGRRPNGPQHRHPA